MMSPLRGSHGRPSTGWRKAMGRPRACSQRVDELTCRCRCGWVLLPELPHCASTSPARTGSPTAVFRRPGFPLMYAALSTSALGDSVLLTAAMFALGCGVRLGLVRQVGVRPFVLAALSTATVALVCLAGVTLAT